MSEAVFDTVVVRTDCTTMGLSRAQNEDRMQTDLYQSWTGAADPAVPQ